MLAPAGLTITPPEHCSVSVNNAATLYVFCSPDTAVTDDTGNNRAPFAARF